MLHALTTIASPSATVGRSTDVPVSPAVAKFNDPVASRNWSGDQVQCPMRDSATLLDTWLLTLRAVFANTAWKKKRTERSSAPALNARVDVESGARVV
jgi:hypothetical protein